MSELAVAWYLCISGAVAVGFTCGPGRSATESNQDAPRPAESITPDQRSEPRDVVGNLQRFR